MIKNMGKEHFITKMVKGNWSKIFMDYSDMKAPGKMGRYQALVFIIM